jgi:predicted small lipoprotein YifL
MIAAPSPMTALAAAAALLLAGCGQTGPLYLPERGEVVTRPATPTPSQPPAAPDPAVTPPGDPHAARAALTASCPHHRASAAAWPAFTDLNLPARSRSEHGNDGAALRQIRHPVREPSFLGL